MSVPRVLIIAGSDSSGGAGIQADIKTVTMLGGFAMTAITAITAQNTLGVDAVMPVPAEMVLKQIDAVVADIGVDVVKIGMLGSAEVAGAIVERLERLTMVPVVFDPVMIATSGAMLADEPTVAVFERLMRLATLITPNLPELAFLTRSEIADPDEMEIAGAALAARTGTAVLAKGGHLPGPEVIDLLIEPQGQTLRWHDPRIDTRNSHGTGCTLASAIATSLGQLIPLQQSVERARSFVRHVMQSAPGFGSGNGPMGHWAGTPKGSK